MKLMNNWIKAMLAVSALCLAACTDDPDVAPLRRDTDAVELTYHADASSQVSVRYNGPWQARVECVDAAGAPVENWFTATPDAGVGNGTEYQWVTVTASRNAGDRRTGYLYLVPSQGGEVKIEIVQADGHFAVEDPVITGALKANAESSAALEIAYDKAFGGEKVQIAASLEGDAATGLMIRPLFETVIEREGSGKITVPLTGTPLVLGKLICRVNFKLDGAVMFDGEVTSSVSSSNEVFRMGFDLFKWGGDYVANKAGISPVPGGGEAPATCDGTEPDAGGGTTAGTNGAKDMFATMSDVYRQNRGITEWTGAKCYERPGYIRLGTGSAGGWVMTPELTGLSTAPETVVVSVDLCRVDNEKGTFLVTAEGAGNLLNGKIDDVVLPAPTGASSRKWTTLSFTVEGATSKTRIKIAAEDLSAGGSRMNLDNLVVMAADVVAVTEKLPAPDVAKIAYVPEERAIAFAWEGVKGATSYEISLAKQSQPDYRKTVGVEDVSYRFDELDPGLYFFTVRALYAPDAAFDSDETSKLVGTLGYAAEKLAAPAELASADVTSTGAKISWTAVSGAANYRVALKTAADGQLVGSEVVAATSYTFTGLTAGTEYTVAVQALVGDGSEPNEFDSDQAELQFTTTDPVPLTAPGVKLYAKTNGQAVIEWTLSEQALTEQPLSGGKVDTYDFRLKDAAGNVIESYTTSKYNAFALDRYKMYRFVFGGLEPATSYTMEMRRISTAAPGTYADSEWVGVPVTTDAAPAVGDYLFHADFESYPYGASPILCAYGRAIGSVTDYTAEVKFSIPSSKNYIYNPGAKWTDASFCAAYAPQWEAAELANKTLNPNVALAAGVMKLGSGSATGKVTLPAFKSLTTPTDVVLEVDAMPYYEPAKAAPYSMQENCAAEESITFRVTVTGGGTVVEADGEAVGAEEAILTNTKADAMGGAGGAEALKRYQSTNHTVKISGATSATRIAISSGVSGNRMWIDAIRVKEAR